ncbi:helix-turn-helix domain-containing protein [Microbacterium sp. A8/3-1]|uniref:Helix-turn-helix domain-containing protein n=1 Tax=Microbacterium sp. A8/3-1 TaxID=3160749 RepID=A0AAU7VX51_9MICO
MPEPKEWVTVKEAAVLVGRTERSVYNWIDGGDLAVVRDGKNRMLVLSKTVLRLSQQMRPGRPKGTPTRR